MLMSHSRPPAVRALQTRQAPLHTITLLPALPRLAMPHTASPYLVQEEEVDLVVVSDLGSQVKQRRAAPCEPVDVDVGLRG